MLAGQWSITTVCSHWKKCFLKLFGNIRMVCLVYTEQRNLFQETQSIGHWNKRSILMQPVREWYWFRDYGPFMTTNQTTAEIVLNKCVGALWESSKLFVVKERSQRKTSSLWVVRKVKQVKVNEHKMQLIQRNIKCSHSKPR